MCNKLHIFRLNCEQYFIDRLTVDHIDYIANYWTDRNKDSNMSIINKYLHNILTIYDFFERNFFKITPILSSFMGTLQWLWTGHSIFRYTIPEYQGIGLSRILSAKLFSNLIEHNIHPVVECIRGVIHSKDLKMCFPGYTWRDSLTGECYW